MKLLLSPVDSYLGQALYHALTTSKQTKKYEIIGSFMDENNVKFKPNSITQWINV
jgi:hypothetical protein